MNLLTKVKNTWCPGCGDFGILTAFQQAVLELVKEKQIKLENIVISGGIGCHAKIMDYLNLNSFYSIHGRVPPTLTGIKIANPNLIPIGFSGDGDSYDEGISHLIHTAKRNSDITMLIHNNQVFALTTGQFTATSPKNFKGVSTPKGSIEEPLNPIFLMLASGATFVARAFARDIPKTKEIIKEAIKHKGFSFVDILQPCVSFNDTTEFYRKRIYYLGKDYPKNNLRLAIEKSFKRSQKIPLGIFYQIKKPTFEDSI